MNPLVSILMPTYNHERFIKQAIESALSQKCDYSYELLINDDCSTDNTLKIAKEYEEALELVEEITKEVYNETKGADIRSYIIKKEQEG